MKGSFYRVSMHSKRSKHEWEGSTHEAVDGVLDLGVDVAEGAVHTLGVN